MKKLYFFLVTLLFALTGLAQDNILTVSGGYAFGNPENYDENTTGYRINGLYEYNPNGGVLANGFSFGYIHTEAELTRVNETKLIKINTVPLYYAPKAIIGKSDLRGFVKGALGMHFSNYSSTGSSLEIETNDSGIFLGVGGGLMYFFNEKIFVNAEYEIDYMGNSYYDDGFVQTVQAGLGFKF